MRLAFTLIGTAAMCAWCMVVYAWTLEQLKRMRGQQITAQAALRRRMDRELDAIRAGIDRELDAIRARMDEELDRLWGHVHEDEPDDEADLDDLAWQPDPAPATQPITLPAPAGPATEPADQVLIAHWAEDVPHPVDSDDRKAQHEAWVTETLARYEYTGRNR